MFHFLDCVILIGSWMPQHSLSIVTNETLILSCLSMRRLMLHNSTSFEHLGCFVLRRKLYRMPPPAPRNRGFQWRFSSRIPKPEHWCWHPGRGPSHPTLYVRWSPTLIPKPKPRHQVGPDRWDCGQFWGISDRHLRVALSLVDSMIIRIWPFVDWYIHDIYTGWSDELMCLMRSLDSSCK